MLNDTIAAIATPAGTGGIGIVRISGPDAERILHRLFRSSHFLTRLKPRRLYHGDLLDPETGEALDEVLACLMKAPRSYTGEDTVEIDCHGGILVVESILQAVLAAGARLAEPGEFTRRAFLNNRIDLSQAEAIGDLISARTARGLNSALTQLKGRLKEKIDSLRNGLIEVLVLLESAIDFSEDAEFSSNTEILNRLERLSADLSRLLQTYREGKLIRRGATVVIAGRPNTGKSSLLNSLLEEKRAIVTPVPGTTRDFLEEAVNIRGIPLRLVDTAGIHPTEDLIEREGIRMVWEKLATADGVLLLLDGSRPLTEEDRNLLNSLQGHKILPVINKTDLEHQLEEGEIVACLPGITPLWISAKFGDGLDALKESLYRLVVEKAGEAEGEVLISTLRHKTALERTLQLVSQAAAALKDGLSQEFAALDIRDALDALGEIAGKTVTEDVLDRIFSSFCIGK